MKIEAKAVGAAPAGPRPGASAAPGFSIPGGVATATATSAAAVVRPAPSLDALLALQEEPAPSERRRRAVRRAGRILDVLDDLKLALLDEAGPVRAQGAHNVLGALGALAGAVREERLETDDMGLQSVLDHIEVRAAVELAKQEVAQSAARGRLQA